jgi:hypothetical protein
VAEQPIGPILDGLGITVELDDGELIESALVLAKSVSSDGSVALAVASSVGMSWLEQLGLIAAAQRVANDRPLEHPDCD